MSKKIAEMEPRHVWISNLISDMTPKEEKQFLETCEWIYLEQVSRGDHVHVR